MRFKKIFAAWLLTAISALTAAAQEQQQQQRQQTVIGQARAVLVRLAELSRKQELQTEAAREIVIGELANPKAVSFGKMTDAPDKILLLDKTRAVGRFQIPGVNDRTIDVYFYLKNDGASWKAYALRAFALPAMVENLYGIWKERTDLSADEKQEFANLKLTLAADKDLGVWFNENRASLDKLRTLAQQKSAAAPSPLYVRTDDRQFPEAAALLKKLNLRLLTGGKNGDVEIVIGGMTDNTVGFVYSPSGKPPEITTYEYIWVEHLADNWYLFRTT
ncbi:MAG TPA: hypothetical protein VF721_09335 [Pyrinomonadaceae bacterium]